MRYTDFENIMTPARMGRYLTACGGNTRKAMTMYRKNLQLSQEHLPSSVVLKSPSEMPLISITRAPSATIGYVMPLLRVVFSITRNAG